MTRAAPPPRLTIAGRSFCSFHVFGVAGLAAAIAAAGAVTVLRGLAAWPLLALAATAILTFFALAYVTKLLAQGERLVYYHHEIAVLAACAAVLTLTGLPLLPYLDAVAVALGVFLAMGRLGCGAVGCCHGRPAEHGVVYREPHAQAGFPSLLVDVPLVPVQWIESAGALFIAAAAMLWAANGAPDGAPLRLTTGGYGVLRFILEPLRGDSDRPYWRGLSEAQWTSVLLIGFALSGSAWGGAAALGVGCLGVCFRRPAAPWFTASHLNELAAIVRRGAGEQVRTTSKGLRISRGAVHWEGKLCRHYSISSGEAPIAPPVARRLAREIAALDGGRAFHWFQVEGRYGVHHILREET